MNPVLNGINLNESKVDSKGSGTADQKASLSGSVTVTVIEILANGNLVVRGEKKLGLAEGTEVIQVSGVIRPQDVGPNGTGEPACCISFGHSDFEYDNQVLKLIETLGHAGLGVWGMHSRLG